MCGLVLRVGWAALKKDIEMSFSVFRKVSCHSKLENRKLFSKQKNVFSGKQENVFLIAENARVLAGKQKIVFKLENRKLFSVENIKMFSFKPEWLI